MAVTGKKYPTAEGQLQSDWLNANYCFAQANNALANATDTYDDQDFYHFDFQDQVPVGAVILGAEVFLNAKVYSVGNMTTLAQLVAGGIAVGDIKTDSWTLDTYVEKTYGDQTDLWGATLSDTIVRADDFGVLFNITVASTTIGIQEVMMQLAFTTEITVPVDIASLTLAGKVITLSLTQIIGADKAALLLSGKTVTIGTSEYIALNTAGLTLFASVPIIIGGEVIVAAEYLVKVGAESRIVIVPAESRITKPDEEN